MATAASRTASLDAQQRRPLAYAGERLTTGAAVDLAVLHALADLFAAPCLTGDVIGREAWTSEDRDDLQLAAQVCLTCPLLDECTGYGRTNKPAAGQWGRYRHPRMKEKV